MKIQRLETYTRGNLSVVKVRTDDGAEGYGQISPFNADISAQVFHRQIAPHALGRDATLLDRLSDDIIESTYKFPGSYVCRALCGLDTALWDLRGRLEGKSVAELLGAEPGAMLTPYGSSMSREITPENEGARLAGLRERYGYRAFKIRIGSVCGHDRDQWPGRTEALVPAVRRAVGDDVALKVDGNSCYTPLKAIQVGRFLEEYGVGHFEEPCPYWKPEWTAEVTRALDLPVAGGEQDYDLEQWRRIIDGRVVDIAQPDICYIGGLTRCLRVARMAAEAGIPVVPHSANLSMVTIFTMHMMAAIQNAGPHFEFSIESTPWTDGLYAPALEVRDGRVAVPDAPGWGVEISIEWLAAADRQVSELD